MKKRNYYFIALLVFTTVLCAQQDAQYSQYMFNQMVINPGYVGSKDALIVGLSNRAQWVDMPGAPKTLSLFIHGPLRRKKVGLGARITQESIGPNRSTGIYTDFSYKIHIKNGTLSLGLAGGILGYNVMLSQLKYKDEGETFINSNGNSGCLDFNTGFYFHNQTFYFGGSATHINSPSVFNQSSNNTRYKLQKHYFLYLGKAWLLNDNLVFNPSLMAKSVENSKYITFDLTTNFLINNKLWLGLSFRQKYGIVFLGQFIINEKFKIGYSYDYGLNRIGTQGKASNEIMLTYDFKTKKAKMASPRYL